MTAFHFLRPWAFWGLIPLVLLLYAIYKNKKQLQGWADICDANLLEQLRIQTGEKSQNTALLIFFILSLIIMASLAGPTWTRLPVPVMKQQQARVIVLDLSRAMLGKDIKPSRLDRAKFQVRDLLKAADLGQVGMVVFTKEAFLVSPLTDDAKTIASMLDELSPQMMPVGGTNITESLEKAQELIHQAGFAKGQVLLFTANKAPSNAINEAKSLKANGIQVDVIGMATRSGAPVASTSDFIQEHRTVVHKLDETSLQALATAGGGSFIPFNTASEKVEPLIQQKNQAQYKKNKDNKLNTWRDEGRLLLLLALPFLLLLFRRGWLENIQ